MYYTVYKTTNLINGKIYVGKHETDDPYDDYIGSGDIINSAKKKYGVKNFKKEILFIFDNRNDMNAKEAELVTKEFISESTNYNIAPGGQGGNIALFPENPRYEEIKSKISCTKLSNGKAISEQVKLLHKSKRVGMHGKNHSDEAKEKIGAAHKGKFVSDETKRRLSTSLMGKPSSTKGKTREEIMGIEKAKELTLKLSALNSERFSGNGNPMHGKSHGEETKKLMSDKAKNRCKIECEHCAKIIGPSLYARWHGNNCKSYIIERDKLGL